MVFIRVALFCADFKRKVRVFWKKLSFRQVRVLVFLLCFSRSNINTCNSLRPCGFVAKTYSELLFKSTTKIFFPLPDTWFHKNMHIINHTNKVQYIEDDKRRML